MFSRLVSVVYKTQNSALNLISAGNVNCCNLSLLNIKPVPHLLQKCDTGKHRGAFGRIFFVLGSNALKVSSQNSRRSERI